MNYFWLTFATETNKQSIMNGKTEMLNNLEAIINAQVELVCCFANLCDEGYFTSEQIDQIANVHTELNKVLANYTDILQNI